MNNQKKGILLVLSTAFISGISIFINRFGVNVVNPYIFTGLKNLIAVLFLLVFILALGERRQFKALSKRQWRRLVLIGLIGGSVPFLLFFKGLSMSTGAEGAFLHKIIFLPVIFLAWIFLREKINKNLVIATILFLIGNILLLKMTPRLILDKGDLLISVAVLFWAIEQIISKKALKEISPKILAIGRLGFGFAFILLFWIFTGQINLLTNLVVRDLFWIWGTAGFLFFYVLTWYSGLKRLKASTAVCILTLGAPITAILEMAQSSKFDFQKSLGAFLVFLGVIFLISLKRVSLVFLKGLVPKQSLWLKEDKKINLGTAPEESENLK